MKVKLKKPVNWFGPYQLAEAICFWAKKEKDEIGIDREPEWVHDFGTWLAGENHDTWLTKFLQWYDKVRRKFPWNQDVIVIDYWDTWSMDHSLAPIILPMLKQLKARQHGAPLVDDEDEDGDDGEQRINRTKESSATNEHQEPRCETDENYRRNEESLIDKKARDYLYVNLPTPDLGKIITPAKRVQEILTKEFSEQTDQYEVHANTLYNAFRKKNERYIGLLAKEFEMRKAASKFAKAKTAETGDLDIGKIFKYQIDDNIFKRVMKVPKGKSHGLVLLLDKSGSMTDNLTSSYEQILILAMFCRKVNIPFTVYGFGDACDGRMIDFPGEDRTVKGFKPEANEFAFETVYLREYLNSKMSNVEFNRSTRNLIALRDSYAENSRGRWGIGRPNAESLGNTPLIQAIVALESITQQFRKVNNLDLVNLVIVHDGDADNCNSVMQERDSYDWENKPGQKLLRPYPFHAKNDNVYIKDRDSKLQIKIDSCVNDSYYTVEDGLRVGIFDWYKAKTGAKIFGFFIAGQTRNVRNGITNKYIDKNGKTVREQVYADNPQAARYQQLPKTEYVKNLSKQLQSEKFLQSYNKGYDLFFILPGGNELQIEDEELVVNGVVTANKLKTAFMKMNKKKAVSRVMVSRFIDGIAS